MPRYSVEIIESGKIITETFNASSPKEAHRIARKLGSCIAPPVIKRSKPKKRKR